ncbi:hypothetical protein [Streptomyces sp. NPDC048386]|uniref:hypothetical protein n=1 Tax=Streptomyces sp. NPDC048386 TaxID=3365541 RepID=UPI00371275E7
MKHTLACAPASAPHPSELAAHAGWWVAGLRPHGGLPAGPLPRHRAFGGGLVRRNPGAAAQQGRLAAGADDVDAPKWYQRRITRQVREPAGEYGIGPNRAGTPRRIPVPAPEEEPAPPEPTQLTLL